MSRIEHYRNELQALRVWEPYLRRNSGLPGPRGNLELAHAAAGIAGEAQIEGFLQTPPDEAAENTPGVFLVFCGVLGLGFLTARGAADEWDRLRQYAADQRWRIREAVAIALQLVGDHDMRVLLKKMRSWNRGGWYEKRAVAAALAEPRLLKPPVTVRHVITLFNQITGAIESAPADKPAAFKVLRQTMGYAWSVAVAAAPEAGKSAMESWSVSDNADVRWIMRENLRKNRLIKLDARWVNSCLARLK